jgi:nicotinamide phosphoribosyltransferase
LDEIFGHTINSKGYKELNSHIGLIYGEALHYDLVKKIFETMNEMGYASTNLVCGIGSYEHTSNKTRDTFGVAEKGVYCETNGIGINIFKDPITDDGMKKSAKGLLKVNEDLTFTQECTWEQEAQGLLETVFENGKLVREHTLAEIRERVRQ